MDLALIKTPAGFAPADEDARAAWQKIPQGTVVVAKVRRPRNWKLHRKLFALFDMAYLNLPESMMERYPTRDHMVTEIKLQAGHYKEHVTLGGKLIYIPRSISDRELPGDEFEAFYEKAFSAVVRHIIPGIDSDELRRAVLQEIGEFA